MSLFQKNPLRSLTAVPHSKGVVNLRFYFYTWLFTADFFSSAIMGVK